MLAVPGGVYDTPAPAGAPRLAFYLPDNTCPFSIKDGVAEPIPFKSFDTRFGALGNIANPKAIGDAKNDRLAILKRLAARGSRATTPEQAAGMAAEQIRLNNLDAALNTLAPFTRAEPGDFRVLINQAHAFASRNDWDAAIRFHEQAVLGRPGFPREIPGIKPDQLAWLQTVEKRYYTKWLAIHRLNTVSKPNPETDVPFPLFGDMKFVNAEGAYEPGKLAPDERKKLPPDAIAIVQQLLLWSPGDTSLYWLLGELYAAEGSFEEAKTIFDRCVDTRQFSNRKLLKEHRAVLAETLANQPKPAAPSPPPQPDPWAGLPSKRTVYIILGAFAPIAMLLVIFQLRALRKRIARKPTGS
jgi:hypothetical protein